ncbi:MAG: cysteine desulfurase [Spirochaetales bacterium]|nr:cysteine desulfurase [Spirochaetales bacterium]
MIYLDWAATAPPIPDIHVEACETALELFANPSSVHGPGKAARECIEQARETCAGTLGVAPSNIFFTAGGTESNNIVLSSLLARKAGGSVVLTGIEHPSVYEPANALKHAGFVLRHVKAGPGGIVDPERFAAAVDDTTVLAAVMLVNNETGAIQPVKTISRLIREKESLFSRHVHVHTDAVQAFGKWKLRCADLGIDSLSASGHKLGGPRGAGVLYLGRPLTVVHRGGEQEGGVRPGTENLQAIFGLQRAIERWEAEREKWFSRARELRRFILERVSRLGGARLLVQPDNGSEDDYSPFIMTISFPPIPGEVLVRVMNDRGFAVSTGSACSSRGKKSLRVLTNSGTDDAFAQSAIRVSIGPETKHSDCEAFCGALESETRLFIGKMERR